MKNKTFTCFIFLEKLVRGKNKLNISKFRSPHILSLSSLASNVAFFSAFAWD